MVEGLGELPAHNTSASKTAQQHYAQRACTRTVVVWRTFSTGSNHRFHILTVSLFHTSQAASRQGISFVGCTSRAPNACLLPDRRQRFEVYI